MLRAHVYCTSFLADDTRALATAYPEPQNDLPAATSDNDGHNASRPTTATSISIGEYNRQGFIYVRLALENIGISVGIECCKIKSKLFCMEIVLLNTV